MVGDDVSARRQAHAVNFADAAFKKSITTERDLENFRERLLPDGYSARLPSRSERLNTYIEGVLVLPLRHFDVGLRLPLWPEYCEILRYFDIVPKQINPNSVAIIMGFLCYLHEERVAFDLSIFRKIFAFAATVKGVVYFASHVYTLVGTTNKVHHWSELLVIVEGNFDGVLRRPHQLPMSPSSGQYWRASTSSWWSRSVVAGLT
ncbi:hypothetical protein KSP40_PGU007102 [Platanthera guangdongensis]|uniref:Transposase (putative) gypsy type domain-containing protein n=1 Tax=Platanthera guangdongensis TaxID=2320717 RepID=A0ABR2M7U0_9ASPA